MKVDDNLHSSVLLFEQHKKCCTKVREILIPFSSSETDSEGNSQPVFHKCLNQRQHHGIRPFPLFLHPSIQSTNIYWDVPGIVRHWGGVGKPSKGNSIIRRKINKDAVVIECAKYHNDVCKACTPDSAWELD